MKWMLRELAVFVISVVILVPMVVVMLACIPFAAIWSLCVDDDGLEGSDGSTDV
jgi:hypothetical protein